MSCRLAKSNGTSKAREPSLRAADVSLRRVAGEATLQERKLNPCAAFAQKPNISLRPELRHLIKI